MRIDFDDEEYPELSRYLADPKKKMKFLYFLETLFEQRNFDPVVDGLAPHGSFQQKATETTPDISNYLEKLTAGFTALSEKLDGAFIANRFPVEHVIHEVEKPAIPKKKQQEEEEDFSDDTGIDFSAAIAAFEE